MTPEQHNSSILPLFHPSSRTSNPGVYADLRELTALQFKASGFTFLPQQPIHSLLSGRHASRLRGRGLNFEEIRRYLPGDDIRNMDWRVTARARKPHVRVYTEERDRPCLVVVDQRIPMFFGSVRNMKSVTAAELAGMAAWRVLSQKDRVGSIVFGDTDLEEISPHRSRANVMRVLGSVVKFNHALSLNSRIEPNRGMLNEALRRTDRLATHDFLICLITDGTGFDAESRRLLTRVARQNDVLIGFIYDPMEESLPDAGPLVLGDEAGQLAIDSGSKRVRDEFQKSFTAQLDEDRRFLLRHEAPVISLCTDSDVDEQLRRQLGVIAR